MKHFINIFTVSATISIGYGSHIQKTFDDCYTPTNYYNTEKTTHLSNENIANKQKNRNSFYEGLKILEPSKDDISKKRLSLYCITDYAKKVAYQATNDKTRLLKFSIQMGLIHENMKESSQNRIVNELTKLPTFEVESFIVKINSIAKSLSELGKIQLIKYLIKANLDQKELDEFLGQMKKLFVANITSDEIVSLIKSLQKIDPNERNNFVKQVKELPLMRQTIYTYNYINIVKNFSNLSLLERNKFVGDANKMMQNDLEINQSRDLLYSLMNVQESQRSLFVNFCLKHRPTLTEMDKISKLTDPSEWPLTLKWMRNVEKNTEKTLMLKTEKELDSDALNEMIEDDTVKTDIDKILNPIMFVQ